MYEYLKKLLEVAEAIGKIDDAAMHPKGSYRPAGIEIEGKIADGRAFELTMRVEDAEEEDE